MKEILSFHGSEDSRQGLLGCDAGGVNMEATRSSKTLVPSCNATQRHNAQDLYLNFR
jgi:hypothetical protein